MTPSPIEVLKQRAREEWRIRYTEDFQGTNVSMVEMWSRLDTLIDEVIASVEKEVDYELMRDEYKKDVQTCPVHVRDKRQAWNEGLRMGRIAMNKAFRTLKGEEK